MTRAIDRIEQGPAGPTVGAFFDYDGTLIDGYSVLAYYADRLRTREMGLGEMATLARQSLKRRLSDEEFDDLIRKGVLEWAGRPEAEMRALWMRLFRERIADNQFPEAWQLVQAHKRMGHTVAIASSATRYQIEPLAQEWEIAHILCTEVVVRKQHLTGAVLGQPAWGQGKADAVAAFARRTGIKLRQSYAYANGDEDIAFLRKVGKASAINPKAELAQAAEQANWPVLKFAPRRIPTLKTIARSAGTYGAMAASFATGLVYARVWGDKRRAVDLTTSLGSELALASAGIDIAVQGEENLWAKRPAIFIFNHQSKLDLLLMAYLVRRGLTGVAKKEVGKVPGIGAFMRMADVAFVDRGNAQGRECRVAAGHRHAGQGLVLGHCTRRHALAVSQDGGVQEGGISSGDASRCPGGAGGDPQCRRTDGPWRSGPACRHGAGGRAGADFSQALEGRDPGPACRHRAPEVHRHTGRLAEGGNMSRWTVPKANHPVVRSTEVLQ